MGQTQWDRLIAFRMRQSNCSLREATSGYMLRLVASEKENSEVRRILEFWKQCRLHSNPLDQQLM
jgi:hypothetical protein